jgi:hypothetical protein
MENEISYTFTVVLHLGAGYDHSVVAGIPRRVTLEGAKAAIIAAALLPGRDEKVARPVEDLC